MANNNGQALVALRRRFDEWRRVRPYRTRIPEPLWAAAVQAACQHGVWKTCKGLKVDYYSLKRRLAAKDARGQEPIEFVEVTPKVPPSGPACVLEMHDDLGRRLHVQLRDAAGAEALVRSLWSAPR